MLNKNIDWEKFEIVKQQMEILRDIINKKFEIMSIVVALSATLLVVATFNNTLLEVTLFVKGLLVVLLFLIPLSLWAQMIDLELAEKNSCRIMKKIGIDVKEIVRINRKEKGYFNWITVNIISWIPRIILLVLTSVIFMIIFLLIGWI